MTSKAHGSTRSPAVSLVALMALATLAVSCGGQPPPPGERQERRSHR
jgi:hypothetical protein